MSKGKTTAAKKKRGGKICKTKLLESEVWEDFWANNAFGQRKKKATTQEQVRNKRIEEEINEYNTMQSNQYHELNKRTKEWTFNSHLLDNDKGTYII